MFRPLMDWRLKALGFRLLDLPGGDLAHFWLQRYVTKSWPRPDKRLFSFPERANALVEDCVRYLGRKPETVLEIGAGRDLAMPLSLRKAGISHVIASDINRLARIGLINSAAKRLIGKSFEGFDELDQFGITYLAPHVLSGSDGSVDCSCSNEVLEHVPAERLLDLLKALRAVTKGLTVHSIDYSDHYARSDQDLSRLNFLKYSSDGWRRFNSRMQYVNRLRHSDYLQLFENAGFRIVEESSIQGVPPHGDIAHEFCHYEPSDLFAVKGRIVAI
jgi:hypothetical protein